MDDVKTSTKLIAAAAAASVLFGAAVTVGPGGVTRPVTARGPGAAASALASGRTGGPVPRPTVANSLENDVSPPLRSLKPLPAPPGWQPRVEGPEEEGAPVRAPVATGQVRDPVLQSSQGDGRMSAPSASFDGISQADQLAQGFWSQPPDTNGDVGPTRYVQIVNLSFAVYSKTGALQYGPAQIKTLWSGFAGKCQSSMDGDPIVLYDPLADRWLMSQFAMPNYPAGPFYECIAVSRSSDPAGTWNRYEFKMSDTKMNDYPKLAVWPDGYYMTTNQFGNNSTTWAGARVVAFERSAMLAGDPARALAVDMFIPEPTFAGALPADLDGPAPPAGSPALFVESDDDSLGWPQDQLEIWSFHADWTTTSNSYFAHTTDVATAAFDSNLCNYSQSKCIDQPGTSVKLDPVADKMMYRLQYRNFGGYQTLVLNHSVDANGNDRAGIRWYELRDSGSGWAVNQQGTYSPDSSHRWMGSAAMDSAGDIAVGYSLSSSSVEPSIAYAGRVPTDPAGTLGQAEATLVSGGGHETDADGRWGDYSSMSVDPSDDCTFWYTNQYYASSGVRNWRTRIAAFRFPGCGTPPGPDTTPPTGVAVTSPTTRFNMGAFTVAWTASDPESGVAGYDVSYRVAPFNGDFGSAVPWQTAVATTSSQFTPSPSNTYCFSVTATDNANNTSGSSPETCTAAPVDDTTMGASGQWIRKTGAGFYQSTFSRASSQGSLLTLPGVQADTVTLSALKCRRCGSVLILWNGSQIGSVNLHSRRTKHRTFDIVSFGVVQSGTLSVEVASIDRAVKIDSVGISRA